MIIINNKQNIDDEILEETIKRRMASHSNVNQNQIQVNSKEDFTDVEKELRKRMGNPIAKQIGMDKKIQTSLSSLQIIYNLFKNYENLKITFKE